MSPRTLILGIGNVLWADEGFGVRCVEALLRDWSFPSHVRVMDGGTQGLYLLPFLEEAEALLVFDAVDYGLPPGTLKVVEGPEVPAFMGAKKMSLHQTGFQDVLATATLMGRCPSDLMSLHQTGFQDVLATATLMGRCPSDLVLIGCQPEELEDYGGGLRASVAAQIAPAIEVALRWLAARGIEARPGAGDTRDLADPSILREAYEAGRPGEDEAYRHGDARFLPERG